MSELCLLSASTLAARLRAGELRSRDLLEAYHARAQRLNGSLNAIVTWDMERARRRSDELDALAARGKFVGPLHGLPITLKDTLETAGLRTTAGAPMLSEHVPATNADAVQRLLDAGAVLFGKTNVPVFAADLQSYNPIFGVSNNPWDRSRTPGGSSGGSASAVAAGLTSFELGSDIGGSLRTPAHFCGIYTLKPTHGIVPGRGHIPGMPGHLAPADIGCIGPLARSAQDLQLVMDVVAGASPEARAGWKLDLPPPRAARLDEYRVAAWLDDERFPIDRAVREPLEACVAALERAGVAVDRTARPAFSLEQAADIYLRLLICVTSADMPNEVFAKRVAALERAPAHARDKLAFNWLRYSTLSAREMLAADEARHQMRAHWNQFFQRFDVLLCPVNPVTAFAHLHTDSNLFQNVSVNGEAREYAEMLIWNGALAGVSHLPAAVAPVGVAADGLPVGMQIIAPYLHDRTAIDFAARLQQVVDGYRVPAGYE